MDKTIGRFFLCLLIHLSMFLVEFIIRILDGDIQTGGLLAFGVNTKMGLYILTSSGLLGAVLVLGIMGKVMWKKSPKAAIFIAPLLSLASLPYFVCGWFVYACSTMGECF